jgi:2,4-dienoyl-CoA reductase-like NADH-dependent reductase (Old Yellow Enzyme family)
MSPGEIEQVVENFGASARRVVEAGFDGVHIHGANGYLISEFASQVTNHRTDEWGGTPDRRDSFLLAVIGSVRRNVPTRFPVSMKVGLVDRVDCGVELEESIQRTMRLVAGGLDAVEVSCGLMKATTDSAAQYVNVTRRQALTDVLLGALLSPAASEAYFRPWASALAASIDVPIILTGGVRSAPTMRSIIESGDAQFIGLARPLIRQPDLVSRLRDGDDLPIECTSCNLCMRHSGTQSLRCWRAPKRRLLAHVLIAGVERIRGLRAGAG